MLVILTPSDYAVIAMSNDLMVAIEYVGTEYVRIGNSFEGTFVQATKYEICKPYEIDWEFFEAWGINNITWINHPGAMHSEIYSELPSQFSMKPGTFMRTIIRDRKFHWIQVATEEEMLMEGYDE